MKVIYIASSWKNQHAVEMLTDLLRENGHAVRSFVEKAVSDEGRDSLAFDVERWIQSDAGREKFKFDITSAMTSDMVIYIGPSGTDAWAEVGAAYAAGVPVLGLLSKGEQIGLMRHLILEWHRDFRSLLDDIDHLFEQDSDEAEGEEVQASADAASEEAQ